MTSRERVAKAINREKPDRLPFNFWMDRQRMAEFEAKYGVEWRHYHYGADVVETFPAIPWFSEFWHRIRGVKHSAGIDWPVRYAFETVEDLRDIAMPDPEQASVCAPLHTARAALPDVALFPIVIHPMELLMGNFGTEGFSYALADDADMVETTLYRCAEVLERVTQRICRETDPDVIYLMGDFCTTRGAMMSHDMLRRFCFEPFAGIVKTAHAEGKKVFLHTDGNVGNILGLFVEYGLDGINPLQTSCNDFEAFSRDWGDKLMVYGGMDNLFILPDATDEEVVAHLHRNFDLLGRNAGYIASSHDIPYHVTDARIDLIAKTLRKCRY